MSTTGRAIYRKDSPRCETSGSDKVRGERGSSLARAVDIAYRKWLARRGLEDLGFRKTSVFGKGPKGVAK